MTGRIKQAQRAAMSPFVRALIWVSIFAGVQHLATWALGYEVPIEIGPVALYFAFVAEHKANALARDAHHKETNDGD